MTNARRLLEDLAHTVAFGDLKGFKRLLRRLQEDSHRLTPQSLRRARRFLGDVCDELEDKHGRGSDTHKLGSWACGAVFVAIVGVVIAGHASGLGLTLTVAAALASVAAAWQFGLARRRAMDWLVATSDAREVAVEIAFVEKEQRVRVAAEQEEDHDGIDEDEAALALGHASSPHGGDEDD